VSADLEGAHRSDQVALRMEKGELVLEVATAGGLSARQVLGSGSAPFRLDGQERTLAVEDLAHTGHPFILAGAREHDRVLLYVLRWDPSDPNGPLLSAYAQGKMFVSDAGRPPDAISVSTRDGTVTAAGLQRGEQGSRPALFHFRWSRKDSAFEPAGVDPAP
jgi:hypothetical protein